MAKRKKQHRKHQLNSKKGGKHCTKTTYKNVGRASQLILIVILVFYGLLVVTSTPSGESRKKADPLNSSVSSKHHVVTQKLSSNVNTSSTKKFEEQETVATYTRKVIEPEEPIIPVSKCSVNEPKNQASHTEEMQFNEIEKNEEIVAFSLDEISSYQAIDSKAKIVQPETVETTENEEDTENSETIWIEQWEPLTDQLVTSLGNLIFGEVGGYLGTKSSDEAIYIFELTGSVVLHRLEVGYTKNATKLYDVVHAKGQYGTAWQFDLDYRRGEEQGAEECYEVAERLLREGPIGPRNLVYQATIKQGTPYYNTGKDPIYATTYFGTDSKFADYEEVET